MTPENAARLSVRPAGLTPENAELLTQYAGHLEHSPLSGAPTSARSGPT
jgi:hypothetical protein